MSQTPPQPPDKAAEKTEEPPAPPTPADAKVSLDEARAALHAERKSREQACYAELGQILEALQKKHNCTIAMQGYVPADFVRTRFVVESNG